MPTSVTVAISLGTQNTKEGDNKNDCFSKKNIESPSLAQGQGTTAAPLPSHATLKIPQHLGGGLQTQALELGKSSVTGAKRGDASQINKYHHDVAKAAPAPIKRTKKVAKPKIKAKASHRGRKLPTKKNKGANDLRPTEATPLPSKKPPPNSKNGGESATAVYQKLPPPKDVHPQTNKSKAKIKRPKLLPPNGEPPKKRAKKVKMAEDPESNLSTTNSQESAISTRQGRGDSSQNPFTGGTKPKVNFPRTILEDSQIEKVVSVIVDMVADEIRYCASVFGAKSPNMVIDSEEDSPNEKISSATATSEATGNLPGGGRQEEEEEFESSKKHALSLKSSGFYASNRTDKKQGAALSTGYSIKISAEGNIHPVKNSACSLETREYGNSANSESRTKSETFSQGRPPSSELYDIRTVVIAVRRFVLEVYCPFLLSARKNAGNNSPSADRIRLSTLLAIREMLIMNADKLFSFSSLKRSSTEWVKRDRIYLPVVFANAIVKSTAKRLHSRQPESSFYADFIRAAQNYDAKSDDFQFSMDRADVRSVYTYPEGGKVGQEESVLAKVSFNYARARHPLLYNKRLGVGEDETSLTHPVPTACAAFHIEAAAASDKTKDATKILASLRKVLRRKHD